MISASVVIPTYNAEEFIEETLNSVFQQTVLPAEIIVVDDCSTDGTVKRLAAIKKRSPVPLHVRSTKRNSGGPPRPYNVGIEEVRSELVLLLDQDDLMYPKRLELQATTLESAPHCILAIGRFSIIGSSPDDLSLLWNVSQFEEFRDQLELDAPYSILESETAFPPLLRRNYAGSCSNFAFFKKTWQQLGGFDEKVSICNDLDAILRATATGPIAIINERLFQYRWSPKSLFRRDLTRSLLDATMARLRIASNYPDLAGETLESLRYSALMLSTAVLRKGDFDGVRSMAETMILHRGATVVKKALDKKVRRLQKNLQPSEE